MSEIRTFSGVMFDFEHAVPWDVNLKDIAHSLGNTCRFNGHSPEFYSVAEHSCLVATLLQHRGYDRLMQAAGLMHDATEAYVGDMVGPLKELVGGAFKDIEDQVWSLISERFKLPAKLPEQVKLADHDMLMIELNTMWPDLNPALLGSPDPDELRDFRPACNSNKAASERFLRAAHILEIF